MQCNDGLAGAEASQQQVGYGMVEQWAVGSPDWAEVSQKCTPVDKSASSDFEPGARKRRGNCTANLLWAKQAARANTPPKADSTKR